MSFKQIKGQPKAVSALTTAIISRRLSHAYLFTGIDGIGKRTTALELAKAVNCTHPVAGDSCGTCQSCGKIEAGLHPDVRMIEPNEGANNIKIEQIREIKRWMRFRPNEGHYRVTIIPGYYPLTDEAANALLKTLEEPPQDNILVLTAVDRKKVLATIASRCQQIPFNPLSETLVAEFIAEKYKLDYDQARLSALMASGSLKWAGIFAKADFFRLREDFVALMSRQGRTELSRVFSLSKRLSQLKEDLNDFFYLMKLLYRDELILASDGASTGVTNFDHLEVLQELARDEPGLLIFDKLDRINRAERAILRNANRQLTLDTLLIRLLATPQ
ncbi:MAG: DNA polymerase III subunit delta' [Deltaproteobacteria bacterium]|nr:DNA polymerase III subunit delta' [Deltaproteobacteria bacterium]